MVKDYFNARKRNGPQILALALTFIGALSSTPTNYNWVSHNVANMLFGMDFETEVKPIAELTLAKANADMAAAGYGVSFTHHWINVDYDMYANLTYSNADYSQNHDICVPFIHPTDSKIWVANNRDAAKRYNCTIVAAPGAVLPDAGITPEAKDFNVIQPSIDSFVFKTALLWAKDIGAKTMVGFCGGCRTDETEGSFGEFAVNFMKAEFEVLFFLGGWNADFTVKLTAPEAVDALLAKGRSDLVLTFGTAPSYLTEIADHCWTNEIDLTRLVLHGLDSPRTITKSMAYYAFYTDAIFDGTDRGSIYSDPASSFVATTTSTSSQQFADWFVTEATKISANAEYMLIFEALFYNMYMYMGKVLHIHSYLKTTNADVTHKEAAYEIGYRPTMFGLLGINPTTGTNDNVATWYTLQYTPNEDDDSTMRRKVLQPQSIQDAYTLEFMPPFLDRTCHPTCPACYDGICARLSSYVQWAFLGLIMMSIFIAPLMYQMGFRADEDLASHIYYFTRKFYAIVEIIGGFAAIYSFRNIRPDRKDFQEWAETIITIVAYVDIAGGIFECVILPLGGHHLEDSTIESVIQCAMALVNITALVVYTDFMSTSALPLNEASSFTFDYILCGLEVIFFCTGKVVQNAMTKVQTAMSTNQQNSRMVGGNQ